MELAIDKVTKVSCNENISVQVKGTQPKDFKNFRQKKNLKKKFEKNFENKFWKKKFEKKVWKKIEKKIWKKKIEKK